MLSLILGLLIFLVLANFFLEVVPIPRGIAGTVVVLLILVLTWQMVF